MPTATILESAPVRFFTRLTNLAPHELPRVSLAWSLRFFFQTGWTIGWTMLNAIFVNRLGIEYLPLLFIANAGLTIVGTMAFAEIIHRVSRRTVIFTTAIGGVTLLGAAFTLFHATTHIALFLGVALLAEAIFFAQLNILLGLFIEDIFSPLESERVFPIVETSEYIGGIVGGLIILGALRLWNVEATTLIIAWASSIALILPTLLVFYRSRKKLPSLKLRAQKKEASGFIHLREGARHIRSTPFLIGLLIVVLLQWTAVTLLNYQYTSAIDSSVGTHETATTTENTHASGENTTAHEHLLLHGLGSLHIGFSVLALTVQLFMTSRIIGRLGIVRSLSLHPLVGLVTTSVLALKFGFGTAVASKALFEATTGIYTAAYHASFYALKESVREHAKEFLEGFIRPFGVIIGTGLLFAVTHFAPHDLTTLGVSLVLVAAVSVMALLLNYLRRHYTHISKKNLELFGDHPAKFTSVEVLAQAGHADAAAILVKNLLYKKESERLRVKILDSLGRIRDTTTIPEIIACCTDKSHAVQLAAVHALAEFKDLGTHFFTQSFTRHRVITSLKELFAKEDSKELRSAIVHVFANMNQAEVVPFLIDTLDTPDTSVRADCIYVCGLFHDVSAAHYLEPFLSDANPAIKANAIIALWQFPQYRLRLTIMLTSLLESNEKETQKAAIHMLGEIGALQEQPRLERYLTHEDEELQLLAALALAKLDHPEAARHLARFALHADPRLADLARHHLKHIPEQTRKRVENIMHQHLGKKIAALLADYGAESLSDLPPDVLGELKEIYKHAGDWHEVTKIDAALAGCTIE